MYVRNELQWSPKTNSHMLAMLTTRRKTAEPYLLLETSMKHALNILTKMKNINNKD